MTEKTITEKRKIKVCDMCKIAELTNNTNQDLIGDTFPTLNYEILSAFKLEGKEVKTEIIYNNFPNNTILLRQHVKFGNADKWCICYNCYLKIKDFISNYSENKKTY